MGLGTNTDRTPEPKPRCPECGGNAFDVPICDDRDHSILIGSAIICVASCGHVGELRSQPIAEDPRDERGERFTTVDESCYLDPEMVEQVARETADDLSAYRELRAVITFDFEWPEDKAPTGDGLD